MLVLGLEVRSSGLVANTFTCWAILLAFLLIFEMESFTKPDLARPASQHALQTLLSPALGLQVHTAASGFFLWVPQIFRTKTVLTETFPSSAELLLICRDLSFTSLFNKLVVIGILSWKHLECVSQHPHLTLFCSKSKLVTLGCPSFLHTRGTLSCSYLHSEQLGVYLSFRKEMGYKTIAGTFG